MRRAQLTYLLTAAAERVAITGVAQGDHRARQTTPRGGQLIANRRVQRLQVVWQLAHASGRGHGQKGLRAEGGAFGLEDADGLRERAVQLVHLLLLPVAPPGRIVGQVVVVVEETFDQLAGLGLARLARVIAMATGAGGRVGLAAGKARAVQRFAAGRGERVEGGVGGAGLTVGVGTARGVGGGAPVRSGPPSCWRKKASSPAAMLSGSR